MYNNNVTRLESLPDLDDLEEEKNYISEENYHNNKNKYSKFIRQSYYGKPESGMGLYKNSDSNVNNSHNHEQQMRHNENQQMPHIHEQQMRHNDNQQMSHIHEQQMSDSNISNINSYDNEQFNSCKKFNNIPTCLDIAEHISNCPICSKFYNNDKTIYIIAIVVLFIIVLILLKKILDL